MAETLLVFSEDCQDLAQSSSMILGMSEKAQAYGEILRRAMTKHGDTQADAARRLDKSAPTIGTYVRGEIEMPYVVRERVVRTYNVPPEDLDVDPDSGSIDKDVIALCISVLRLPDLSPENRDLAAAILERMTLARKS